MDSVKDILANKLSALADRKDVKDDIDIFFALRKGPDLSVDEFITYSRGDSLNVLKASEASS